jgi:hypothetical protein
VTREEEESVFVPASRLVKLRSEPEAEPGFGMVETEKVVGLGRRVVLLELGKV